jgi:hypothetical protein
LGSHYVSKGFALATLHTQKFKPKEENNEKGIIFEANTNFFPFFSPSVPCFLYLWYICFVFAALSAESEAQVGQILCVEK